MTSLRDVRNYAGEIHTLKANSWNPHMDTILAALMQRVGPPARTDGDGWMAEYSRTLFQGCQCEDDKLIFKFMLQTLAAKVKQALDSGKENGAENLFFFFSFFFFKLFAHRCATFQLVVVNNAAHQASPRATGTSS